MYKKAIITIIIEFLILLFSVTLLLAQSKYTVSGTVKQKSSGETLIGASIVVVEKPGVGVITNEYGFYSLSLPPGNYTLLVSFVGYTQQLIPVTLNSNVTVNVSLSDDVMLEEVVVTSNRNDENITTPTMGTEVLDMKAVAKLPVVFGEKDFCNTGINDKICIHASIQFEPWDKQDLSVFDILYDYLIGL